MMEFSDARFDTAMARAMKNVSVPAELAGAILKRLARIRWRRRITWAAIAATVLLTGVVAYLALHRPDDAGTYIVDPVSYQ